jgi:hypothetical protein
MQKKIKQFLNHPIPLFLAYPAGKVYFKWLILVLALWVNVFQPFGLTLWTELHKVLVLTFYCVVYCRTYHLTHIVYSYIKPPFFSPEHWTVGKQMHVLLFYLPVMAATTIIFAKSFIPEFELSPGMIFRLQLYNVLTLGGIIPLFGFIVTTKLKTTVSTPVEPVAEKEKQENIQPKEIKNNLIQWKETSLDSANILFAECHRNDLHVHYLHNDKKTVLIKRESLKEFELLVAGFPQLVRCHVSFVVNMNHVQSWSNGNKKLTLYLDVQKLTVPVSETYLEKISELIEANFIPKKM